MTLQCQCNEETGWHQYSFHVIDGKPHTQHKNSLHKSNILTFEKCLKYLRNCEVSSVIEVLLRLLLR